MKKFKQLCTEMLADGYPEAVPTNNKVTVYHVTDTEPGRGQKSGFYPGTYSYIGTPDKSYGDNVFVAEIDAGSIAKNSDKLDTYARRAGFRVSSGNGNGEVEYLKSLGYVGLQRGNEVLIFPNVDIKWKKE